MSAPDVGGLPIGVTFFYSYAADRKREESLAAPALAERIRNTTQHTKESLPWLKLARFGDQKTDQGSFRSDNNMLAITGIEGDYDGERMSFEDARQMLVTAGLAAILYTSPSHKAAKPRWRILCPLSSEHPPSERSRFMGRLNGLFNGIFSDESWTLSQSYYFGSVKRNKDHQVVVLDGTPLDKADELDTGWMGKPNTKSPAGGRNGADRHDHGQANTAELLQAIRDGRSYHRSMIRLIGHYSRSGASMQDTRALLVDAMESVFPTDRDARWQRRMADLDRCLADVYGKDAEKRAKDPDGDPQPEAPLPEPEADASVPDVDISILRLNRRAPPVVPLNVFGHEWRVWIEDVAAASCCPPDYVVAPLLASVSALIGNSRWAQAWPGWEEPPHLWSASVGDSGDGKSPGADPLFRHVLPELERRMCMEFPDQLREWKAAAEASAAAMEQWKTDVRKAQQEKRPPSLPPESTGLLAEPQSPRLRQNDVTIERVASLLATAAPKGLLMVRDELAGFLLGMSAYHDAARPFWLEAYGGRSYRVERQKHPDPIIVPRLVVAWFGTVQPERLADVMQEADDGLLARFMWFWPDPVPFQRPMRPPAIEFSIRALDRLRQLEMQTPLGIGEPTPVMLPMTDEAKVRLVAFIRNLQNRRELVAGLLRSTYGKVRGLVLRIALVLEHLWWCARDGFDAAPAAISDAATEAAAHLVLDYVLPMAARTYGDAASTQAERNISTLARWVAQERPSEVRVRQLQRGELPATPLPGLKEAAFIHEACKALIEAGWLLPAPGTTGPRGGRPPAVYPVNPGLWEHLA
jgi:hypothetical protein